MSLVEYLTLLACFPLLTVGVGLPWARRLSGDPAEQIAASMPLGLGLAYMLSFACYLAGGGGWWWSWWLLPLLGGIGFLRERRTVARWWSDAFTRRMLIGWLLVAAWTQCLLALVQNYNGAAWGADWLEHHQRAVFFRENWPLDHRFLGSYLLPARPPLFNLVNAGAYTLIGRVTFAADQVLQALLASAAIVPLALFCRRAGGVRLLPVLVLLLMLNPSFVQNSTYTWTKLPSALLVLIGAWFLLADFGRPPQPARFFVAALALTLGLLAHYSAGPYCVVLTAWWLVLRLRCGGPISIELLAGVAATVPLLALWAGWSWAHYGAAGTFLSNSSVVDSGTAKAGGAIARTLYNLFTTLVPHPLRPVDYSYFSWSRGLAWFRDYFFLINQVTLPGMLGTGGALALAVAAVRSRAGWRLAPSGIGPRWVLLAAAAIIVLGVAVHGAPDPWGLGHICLQPLVLAGLALLAARIHAIGRVAGALLIAGLLWDAVVNIGLHHALQANPPHPGWVGPDASPVFIAASGSPANNAYLKYATSAEFLADGVPAGAWLPALAFALLTAGILWSYSTVLPRPNPPSA